MDEWAQVGCDEQQKCRGRESLYQHALLILLWGMVHVEGHQKRARQHVIASYQIPVNGACTFRRVHLCSCMEKIILSLHSCSDIKKMLKLPYFDIQNGTHSVFNTSPKNFNNPQNKTKIWARSSYLVGDKCHSATRDNSWWSCWVGETSSKYIYHHQFLY